MASQYLIGWAINSNCDVVSFYSFDILTTNLTMTMTNVTPMIIMGVVDVIVYPVRRLVQQLEVTIMGLLDTSRNYGLVSHPSWEFLWNIFTCDWNVHILRIFSSKIINIICTYIIQLQCTRIEHKDWQWDQMGPAPAI